MKNLKLFKNIKLQGIVLILVAFAGVYYVKYTNFKFEEKQNEKALQIARTIEAALPIADIKALDAIASDSAKPQYKLIKNILKAVIKINNKARFAYIYKERNGKLYFIADSEPENSSDYSPAGQEYSEADKAYNQPFVDGKEVITGSLTDRWGTWKSVLIPITDDVSGKTIAVFAMDFNAKSWDNLSDLEHYKSIAIVFLVLVLLVFIFNIITKNKILNKEIIVRKLAEKSSKQAAKVLRKSEEKYRLITEKISDVVWLMDLNGKSLFVSNSIEKFTGYAVSEYLAQTIYDRFTPASAAIAMENLKKEVFLYTNAKEPPENYRKVLNADYRCKDGSIKTGEMLITPYFDENNTCIGLHGVTRDITERKQAEESLRESESRFKNMFERHNAIMLLIDPDTGTITDSNIAATKFYGYSKAELCRMNINEINTLPPEIVSAERQKALDEIINTFTFQHRLANGEVRIVEVHSSPIYADKKLILFSIIYDITERIQAEQQLQIAKEKAEESDRLKSAFLANMSHEIRTPMNGILGFAELLKEQNLSGEEQKSYIKIIENSGIRMLNIINDIIDISKIESGQMEVSISETDINEKIEYIYQFFKLETEQKGIKLLVNNSLKSEEAIINTDKEKIYAILTNLVKNAVKFTEKGFIEIGCKHINNADFNHLEFYVKDTGIGIKQAQKDIIFERFRQGSELHNRNYEGSGLGLTISKAYVNILGGSIWVESNANEDTENALSNDNATGSVFYFTIPYNAATEQKIIKNPAIPNQSNKLLGNSKDFKLNIMIADDDPDAAILIKLIVQKYCTKIVTAKNGYEAVKICADNTDLDLIFMDIRMPEMDGYEATREIRKFNGSIIIIAQTAFGLTGDREKALAAGCNNYISKPINHGVLLAMIKSYFNKLN